MNTKTALVIGASGLVGTELTKQLLSDDNYQSIHVFVRTPLNLPKEFDTNPKLIEHVVDYNAISQWQSLLYGNDLYCCIGTTLKKAGSKQRQTEIDLDLPFEISLYANKNGVQNIALVSATGAYHQSSSFYLRLKGTLEQNLINLNWQHLVIVRPSFLQGQRAEIRFGEQFAILLFSFLKYVPWVRKYRPIKAKQVARRMRYLMNSKQHEGVVIEELEALFNEVSPI